MSTTQTTDFLTFRLGGLEYGLVSSRVRELRLFRALDRLATDGEIISNVAVSRGVILPLVDMRAAFGTARGAPDPMTDVIILQVAGGAVGMLVDGVGEVVGLRPDQVSAVPQAVNEADYLIGVGQHGGRRFVLIDIDKLMAIRRQRQAA